MTGTKYASAVEYRSALSDGRPGRRTSILMIDAKYGFDIGPRPSVLGNRRLLVENLVGRFGATERAAIPNGADASPLLTSSLGRVPFLLLCSLRFRNSNNVQRVRYPLEIAEIKGKKGPH